MPPGMWSMDNMYLSRADNVPTMRPDYLMDGESIYAVSDDAILQESGGIPDIVNTITGIYGSDRLMYITSYIPWASISGIPAMAMDSYTTGTATAASGSSTVDFAALGVGIDLDQKTWRGALLEIDGDGRYYVVDKVTAAVPGSQTGTVQLVAPTEAAYSGDTYELFFNHNCYRAAFNKAEVQQNGAYLIYGTPDIADQIGVEDITGPFYGQATETDWEYGGHVYYDTSGISNDDTSGQQYTLATNGTSWINVIYGPGTEHEAYWITTNITVDNTWTSVLMDDDELPDNTHFNSIKRNTTRGFLAGAIKEVGGDEEAIVIWSADSGATWSNAGVEDPDAGDADFEAPWQCQCAEDDGTTLTVVMYNTTTKAIRLLYSTDDGVSWNNTTGVNTWTGTAQTKIKYMDSKFVVAGGNGYIYYSSDGQAFTAEQISSDVATMTVICDIAYNNGDGGSDYFVAVSSTGHIARCTTINGTWADVGLSGPVHFGVLAYNYVHYDVRGQKFMIPTKDYLITSVDNGANWRMTSLTRYGIGDVNEPSNIDWSGMDLAVMYNTGGWIDDDLIKWLVFDRAYLVSWEVPDFAPISEDYRSNSVSVLDGYTVLVGMREFESGVWNYYPRRVRWSVAGSPVDFTSTGSGNGDLRGSGALLRSTPVNGRIVIFETVAVGALVPRGDTDDPWDYDIIDENFSFLSNPVVVGGACYIIGTDGLLHVTDGIEELTEIGASFDLNEFDDFDKTKPVWLVHSIELNSIFCYYRDISATVHPAYVISVANGGVSEFKLSHLDDSDDVLVEVPGSVIAAENSSLERTYVSYGPTSDDTDAISLAFLDSGRWITGTDTITSRATTTQSAKWDSLIETGELYITAEGEKSSVKHLIVETYTDGGDGTNADPPYLTAAVKSTEDSDYATSGDAVGTATMTTSALTGSGTAWSTTIAGPNAGSTQQKCNGSTKTFTLPCLGAQARVYLDTTLQTAYTTSAKTITFTTAPGATVTLYAYWENFPEIKAKTGDMFKSSEGWHRVTAISSAQDITVDHYLSTGSETVVHYPAWQLDDGHGRIEIGINRLVEGVQIRLYLIPDYDGLQQSTVAKITGSSIGFVPQGRKIVKATGS